MLSPGCVNVCEEHYWGVYEARVPENRIYVIGVGQRRRNMTENPTTRASRESWKQTVKLTKLKDCFGDDCYARFADGTERGM